MSSAKLIIATNNQGKLTELRTIVAGHVAGLESHDIISAAELDLPDVIEDGVTFADNALLKARAVAQATGVAAVARSEEHTSELQSRGHLVCRLLLEKKKKNE